ncbi:alanyl-tRNA editing protein [[Eubacterium] cellulosolvens]
MITNRLFWEDPYRTECEANVLKVQDNEIVLDQTVFYAFSGGQASDVGTINDIPVIEAKKAGDEIVYVLEKPPEFKQGDKVNVKIDWENRYRLMKLHAASHIIYFIFQDNTGIKKLIGSNVTKDKGRLDYEHPESIASILPDIESKANEIFNEDSEIRMYPDTADQNKRWWECMGWKVPCGGTHVKSTKEIGNIRLKRKNIGSGKERIEIYLE